MADISFTDILTDINKNGKAKNQYSPRRNVKELQEIIDNAPQIKVGDKFLDMNAKDLTGESVNAKKYNTGKQYITRKEFDNNKDKLIFKKTGKQKIKDINKFNYSKNLKGLQPDGLNYKGDSSKNVIHPYPKVVETTTGTTGKGDARINRSLSGYDKEARPIAVKQVELVKNKTNMSPDDFNKERIKLNAQAKQARENIVSKKGKVAKNYTGYFRINESGTNLEPKGFNAKKSFAGIGGEDIKFNNMTKDQLAKFKKNNLNKLNSFPAQLAEFKIPKVNPLKKIGKIGKIGKTGLKGLGKVLGVAAIPLEGYLMNEARKQGKSFAEIAAMPFLLEGKVAEYQDMMNMSPVERQAVNRENIEQDESLLDTDFYTPTLEGVEAVNIPGVKNRVATKRKIEEKLLAEKRAAPKQRFTLPNITGTIDDDFI
jgi:hypothetical protein|tara:strand:- start:44 stop:1324 length:1281 start_codon:yes stop_codon:yes gene_type:complete